MVILVMGVSGCGKSTVASLLADRLGADFVEGDDRHPPENIRKMSSGIPLTDQDRFPWLNFLAQEVAGMKGEGKTIILACSALKKAYRDRLKAKLPELRVIYLKGSRELIERRLADRQGHFMPADLLVSQFADLEEPQDALAINAGSPPEELVAEILQKLEATD